MAEQTVERIFAHFTILVSGRVRSKWTKVKFPYSMSAGSLCFERRSNNLVSSERKDGYLITRITAAAKNPQPGFCIKVKSSVYITQILVSRKTHCQTTCVCSPFPICPSLPLFKQGSSIEDIQGVCWMKSAIIAS